MFGVEGEALTQRVDVSAEVAAQIVVDGAVLVARMGVEEQAQAGPQLIVGGDAGRGVNLSAP